MRPPSRRRSPLPPLDPDRFLAWVWKRLPRELRGSGPLTVDDLHMEYARGFPELLLQDVRRMYLRISARARRNVRLGLDPLEGVH